MVTVGVVAGVVERAAGGGRLPLPGVPGVLAGWGHARERVIRAWGGVEWRLRPRPRCTGCRMTLWSGLSRATAQCCAQQRAQRERQERRGRGRPVVHVAAERELASTQWLPGFFRPSA